LCNARAGKDEEYFFAAYLLGSAGTSEAGQRLWQEKLARTYARNRGLRSLIVGSFRHRVVRDTYGMVFRIETIAELDRVRIDNVLIKLVRGLYFHTFGEPLDRTARIECKALTTQEQVDTVAHLASSVRFVRQDWPNLFEYRCNRVPEDPQGSIWFLRFYGRVIYWVVSCRADLWDALRNQRANE